MKRPSLALLALLASLAMGLAAISPRQSQAATLGELFCAMEIVNPPCHAGDDDHCPECPFADEDTAAVPQVCTPPGVPSVADADDSAPVEAAVEELDQAAATEPAVELNAAATSKVPDNASAWEEDYGYYYGDFYAAEEEQYSAPYANQYETPAEEVTESTETEAAVEDEVAPANDSDFRYGEGYDPWAPVTRSTEETVDAPGPEDLIVEEEAAQAAPVTVEPYDLYGRQVGDAYYGHDYEESPAEETITDYEYEYSSEEDDDTDADADEEDADEESTAVVDVDEDDTAASESYYEEYYPDYYAELYGREESTSEETVEVPAEGTVIEVPNAEIVDDLVEPTPTAEAELPWADEAPLASEASESGDDVAEHSRLESEYGSDYAEEYYRTLFGEEKEEERTPSLKEEEVDTAAPAIDEAYDFFAPPCDFDECYRPNSVTLLVVECGREVFELTQSLELVSMRLHSACLQLAELPSGIEIK